MKRKTKEAESLERVTHTHTHTHTHMQFYQKEENYLVDEQNRKKREAGITLIALVITIIILLILAGISIASLSDNGLFGKAKEAKQKTEEATQNENSTLADYEKEMNDYLSDVSYKIGDEVTVGGEKFYVIENSGIGQNTVTLLAKYNLNLDGDAQAPNANTEDIACAFSSTNYWKDETITDNLFDLSKFTMPDSETASNNAIKKAQAYGTAKGGTGRLLTYDEANTLKDKIPDKIWGITNTQSRGSFLDYWISCAYSTDKVWGIEGMRSIIDQITYSNTGSSGNGVRPVIVISKSLIS